MKLSEFLLEQGNFKPNPQDVMKMPRGKMQQWAGKAPTQRLTKKQQQVKDQQPIDPRQPQQPQQKQQAAPPPQQQQAQLPQQSPDQIKAQDQAKQLLGGVEVTKDNVLKVLPNLIKGALNKDQQWARMLINAAKTASGVGDDVVGAADEYIAARGEAKAEGTPWSTKKSGTPKAAVVVAQAKKAKMNRSELQAAAQGLQQLALQTNEAAPPPAAGSPPPKNPPNAKMIALQQIQAAIKQLTPDQRVTLKSQIQHLVRGGDAAIGKPSLRGVPQQGATRARWKQSAQQFGQQVKQDFKAGTPTFKKWFGRGTP